MKKKLRLDSHSLDVKDYRAIINKIQAAVVVHACDGQIIAINNKAKKYLGLTDKQILEPPTSKPDWNFLSSSGEKISPKEYPVNIVLSTKQPVNDLTVGILKSSKSSIRWAIVNADPVIDAKNKVREVVVTFMDITEQKRAQELLLEKAKSTEQILQTTMDGYILANTKGKLIDVNPAYCKIVGYTREELLEMNIRQLDIASKKDIEKRIEVMVSKGGARFETKHKHKDGSIVELEVSTIIMRQDKEPLVAAFVRDITERKISEMALVESEEKFRLLADNSIDCIWMTDINLRFTYLSPALERIMGIKPSEWIGTKITYHFRKKEASRVNLLISKVIKNYKTHPSVTFETKMLNSDKKEVDLEISGKVLLNSRGKLIGLQGTTRSITERKQTEDALANSENKMRSIFRVAPTGIGLVKNRKLLEVNPLICEMSGYTKEELVGKSSRILYPSKKEFDLVGEEKYRQINLYGSGTVETKWQKKDGTVIDVLLSSTPVDIKDLPRGVIFTALDITSRRRAEDAIKESEAGLNSLINNRNESIWSIDRNYNFITFNRFFSEAYFTTYRTQLKKGMNAIKILTPELKAFWKPKYDAALTGEKIVFDFSAQIKGNLQYFEVSLNPIVSDGKVTGVSALSIDITERRQTEEIIKESEERFKTLFEYAAVPIWLEDFSDVKKRFDQLKKRGIKNFDEYFNRHPEEVSKMAAMVKVIDVNQKSVEFYHARDKDSLIKDLPKYFSEESLKVFRAELIALANGKENFESEIPIVTPSGEKLFLIVSLSVPSAYLKSLERVMVSFLDISDRKKAEAEIIKSRELAVNSEKLKSEFLAQMSHEIRTPINAILSFSGLLKDEIGELVPDDLGNVFDIMSNAGKRIIRTIDLILNMSELQTGTFKPDIRKFDIYKEVLSPLHSQYKQICKEKSIDIVIGKGKGNFSISADEYSTIQIFDNLISNAVKYTESGEINITAKRDSNNLIIEISDTGIGISKQYLPNLFEPFTQEEQGYTRKFEGTGLGLALVKKYCEMNNAKVKCESRKGKGSKFIVTFSAFRK